MYGITDMFSKIVHDIRSGICKGIIYNCDIPDKPLVYADHETLSNIYDYSLE